MRFLSVDGLLDTRRLYLRVVFKPDLGAHVMMKHIVDYYFRLVHSIQCYRPLELL
jgi:hypothetical protein